MRRTSTMRMLTLGLAGVLLLAACASNETQTQGTESGTVATTEATAPEQTAGCRPGSGGEDDWPIVEITAVEYAFQGVPDTVEVGTELCLFNAGDELHDLNVFFVVDESAPVEELIPPQGAQVGLVTALPGEYGLSVVVPEGGGPMVVAPLRLQTPGRYMLYSTMNEGSDPDAWREFLAATEEAGGGDLGPPPFGPGDEDFMKGMVADLVVVGDGGSQGVLDVLRQDGRFDILYDLLVNVAPPHFEGFMSNPDWNLTLLAPTDDAFEGLPNGVLEGLRADPDRLARILDYHVVLSYLRSDDIVTGEVETVYDSLEVTAENGVIRFGGATVIEANIEGSNGIIHAIDALLVPANINLEDLSG